MPASSASWTAPAQRRQRRQPKAGCSRPHSLKRTFSSASKPSATLAATSCAEALTRHRRAAPYSLSAPAARKQHCQGDADKGLRCAGQPPTPPPLVPLPAARTRRSPHALFAGSMGRLFNWTFPLVLLFVALWLAAARLLALVLPALLFPLSIALNRRLAAAAPHLPPHGLRGFAFSYRYAAGVMYRFLTLPLRRRTPHFYVVGFSGTTSLVRGGGAWAETQAWALPAPVCMAHAPSSSPHLRPQSDYLRLHPAISGIDCPPVGGRVAGVRGGGRQGCPPASLTWATHAALLQAMQNESHFFSGALGLRSAGSRALYHSYCPTLLQRWWTEAVRGAGQASPCLASQRACCCCPRVPACALRNRPCWLQCPTPPAVAGV